MNSAKKNHILMGTYVLATVQFVWCYLWLTRAYVNTFRYENGLERMPFQGRVLMMWIMRFAHTSVSLKWLAKQFEWFPFWFGAPVSPEVLIQALIDVACLLLAGIFVTKTYQKSSKRNLLGPFVYPVMLTACGVTYIMHTVQNFRFIYDLPSLMFFAAAMYVIYFRKHWIYFAVVFALATLNRETSLMLLPIYMLDRAVDRNRLRWRLLFRYNTLLIVVPLASAWMGWQVFIRHLFAANSSEFYPRIDWNIKSLVAPHAWPQLLSACGYLLLFVAMTHRRIKDHRIHAWMWMLPIWLVFMFVYGILIETRIFGELIPMVVCATMLIIERLLVERMNRGSSAPILTKDEVQIIRKAA